MSGRDIAKRSVRGSLVLFVGNFSSTAISSITIFLIARLLGPEKYGIYALALVIPGILQLFLNFGVNSAVIRYSAYSMSSGRPDEARRFTANAIYFLWLTGAGLTLLNYVLAGLLSTLLLHRPELTPLVQLMSLAILGNALLQTITFTAIGWNWMSLSSATLVVQAVVKLGLAPFLILAGLGVAGALTGHIVSYLAAGAAGTFVLYRGRLGGSVEKGRFLSDIRAMLGFGVPLYVGGLASSLGGSYLTLILAAIASNTVFGFYQAALNFLLPVSIVSAALVSGLFPAFASFDGIGGNAKQAFRDAYKFVAFLLAPITVFLIPSAAYLVQVFYGGSFAASAPYLRLLALAYLPIAFGYTVHPSYFSGFNRPKLAFLVYFSGAITLVACASIFSLWLGLGVYGLIYATFLSYFVAWLVGTVLAERSMRATMDQKANAAILGVSAIAGIVTFFLPSVLSSIGLSLLADLVVFFGLYLTLAPLAGAVDGRDLDVIDRALRDLKVVGALSGLLVRYERLLLSRRNRVVG